MTTKTAPGEYYVYVGKDGQPVTTSTHQRVALYSRKPSEANVASAQFNARQPLTLKTVRLCFTGEIG